MPASHILRPITDGRRFGFAGEALEEFNALDVHGKREVLVAMYRLQGMSYSVAQDVAGRFETPAEYAERQRREQRAGPHALVHGELLHWDLPV